MIARYARHDMARIWTPDAKYEAWLRVELAVCEVYARRGLIPVDALGRIKARARVQAARIDEDVAYSDTVQQEDREICERVQQGLGSRAYDRGRFSVQMEEGVWAFQGMLKRYYREYGARGISL